MAGRVETQPQSIHGYPPLIGSPLHHFLTPFPLTYLDILRAKGKTMNESDTSRVIEMAWEDRTPFEAIEKLYGLPEQQVIELMRKELKPSSFRLWRKRVSGRKTKHLKLRNPEIDRGYCPTQYKPR